MTVQIDPELMRDSTPAPIVRMFGWSMLAVLTAFCINNVFPRQRFLFKELVQCVGIIGGNSHDFKAMLIEFFVQYL